MSKRALFVTGIGTDVGKTIASAVIVKALQADYWKPVQCGDLNNTDSHKVEKLAGCKILPETYRLQAPMSPHAAAELENIQLKLSEIELPKSDNTIVVEGAGGIMVPFNSRETYLDLMLKLNLPVVLVTRHYLGSINHTMLSWNVLKAAKIRVVALVISGKPHQTTEQHFRTQMDVPFIRISELETVDAAAISGETERLKEALKAAYEGF